MAGRGFQLSDVSETELAAFGVHLARNLCAGDTILLDGPVGAGKTHLARALIQSILIEPEDVPSPTFTLSQVYETVRGTLWHTDLYRITSENEIEELGLTEAFETAICLVEWPDRLGVYAPKDALVLNIEAKNYDTRNVHAIWTSPRWDKLKERVHAGS